MALPTYSEEPHTIKAHYEINVSRDNKHIFATHSRSASNEKDARTIMTLVCKRFPKSEGFEVECLHIITTEVAIDFHDIAR